LAVSQIQTAFSVTECPLIWNRSSIRLLRLCFFRTFLSLSAGVFAVAMVVVVVGAWGNTIVVDVVCACVCACACVSVCIQEESRKSKQSKCEWESKKVGRGWTHWTDTRVREWKSSQSNHTFTHTRTLTHTPTKLHFLKRGKYWVSGYCCCGCWDPFALSLPYARPQVWGAHWGIES